MRVIVARHMGFCGGVRRAVEIALRTAEKHGATYTWGPLIHNPQEVARLEGAGVRVARRLEDLDGEAFVVSAYGVEEAVLEAVRRRGMEIVDATCPVVTRAHLIAEQLAEEGYFVVAVGDHGHPEMVTLKEKLGDRVAVVHTPEEAARLPLRGKVAVVSQTTQSVENFRRIVGDIVLRVRETKVINTLCPAIAIRQEEAERLVAEVDVLLVLGGRHSANTTRLAEIGRRHGRPTYHIETPEELDPGWFWSGCTVGVMSGASTPDWIIQQVLRRLEEIRAALGA
ncbi:MAG: 4-hydroxy-3-methylbut-2-enyl diphosphate reductase [Armatimonadota bacterium]|nr:4-hydroxy-3-methylbut-2-enyl diphosphate reductase [Armatimonadota bacterium]MDR7445221.1 4-hydroxy-3-methylbut-2-enyl diphosphate reductase [Armatimonadota bacterium]MDR7615518.1 4-hydroxy-3-methylbut-2-enyl diphosphate reductase [Armatimonadota bacterium]